MLSLDVAISTHQQQGIERVARMLPEPRKGVKYVVSWQEYGDWTLPDALLREDVTVWGCEKKGLAANRNNALSHCTSDIIIIADDDLIYKKDFHEDILNAFQDNKGLDIAIFKINFKSSKSYPDTNCEMTLPYPEGYWPSSVEIAFRRARLRELRFWEKMGLGNSFLGSGEEELFMMAALKRGNRCGFINKVIASHPYQTTGDKKNPEILRAQGFIISLQYPISFLLRIPLKAFRVSKGEWKSLFKNLWHLSRGAIYSLNYKKKVPENCRWP